MPFKVHQKISVMKGMTKLERIAAKKEIKECLLGLGSHQTEKAACPDLVIANSRVDHDRYGFEVVEYLEIKGLGI